MAGIGAWLLLAWRALVATDEVSGWNIAAIVVLGLFMRYVVQLVASAVSLVLVLGRSAYSLAVLAATVAWLLGKQGTRHPVRMLGLAAFVVGFHFDLLGS